MDHYFAQDIAPSFSISDPQSINALATVTTKSGMIPTQVKTMLNSGATSRDPALVVPMANSTASYSIITRRPRQPLIRERWHFMGRFTIIPALEFRRIRLLIWHTAVFQQDDRMKQMLSTAMRDKNMSQHGQPLHKITPAA